MGFVYSLLDWRTVGLSTTVESGFANSKETVRYFTQGQCHALAWEIHKLTKWTLAILSDDLVGTPDYAGHAFVVNNAGFAVDIRGVQTIEDFRRDWTDLQHMHLFRSPRAYKKEMDLWVSDIAYNRDVRAKSWADYIVNIIA